MDTDSARKLATHLDNGGEDSNKARAFSAQNSAQASKAKSASESLFDTSDDRSAQLHLVPINCSSQHLEKHPYSFAVSGQSVISKS